jgi:hypothetical protein
VLTSGVHMAWARAVCGRPKSDYRYSRDIVHNNFPWPGATGAQRAKVGDLARTVLGARALFPGASLADPYDHLAMPGELLMATARWTGRWRGPTATPGAWPRPASSRT